MIKKRNLCLETYLEKFDWKPIDSQEACKSLFCEECGEPYVKFYKKICSNGAEMIKGVCKNGHLSSHAIPQQKNVVKRTNSTLRHWSYAVKNRDNFCCVICGSEENVEAHHIIPYSHSKTYQFDTNNGVTLCSKCHSLVHKKGE